MYPELIEEFCKKESDALHYANTRRRRSMLLELQKDIDYNLGIFKTFKVLNLTKEQDKQLLSLTPLLVVPLLFCSTIDLIARVKNKVTFQHSMNATFFKDSATSFFGLTSTEANDMWQLRNQLSHQYTIHDFTLSRSGSQKVIEYHTGGRKVIFVRSMRSSIQSAINNLQTYLLAESPDEQAKTHAFIDEYGFAYYLLPPKATRASLS